MLTVKDLIDQLQKLHPDTLIMLAQGGQHSFLGSVTEEFFTEERYGGLRKIEENEDVQIELIAVVLSPHSIP